LNAKSKPEGDTEVDWLEKEEEIEKECKTVYYRGPAMRRGGDLACTGFKMVGRRNMQKGQRHM